MDGLRKRYIIGQDVRAMFWVVGTWLLYNSLDFSAGLKKFKDVLAELTTSDLSFLKVHKSTPYSGCCLQFDEIWHYH